MIQGIGTDIIAIKRIQELKNKEAFVKKILRQQEVLMFETFVSETRKNEFLAGRFAVKEALYKAIGADYQGWEYSDVVILNNEAGAPYLEFPKLKGIHLSISHCREYATAFVVYEK